MTRCPDGIPSGHLCAKRSPTRRGEGSDYCNLIVPGKNNALVGKVLHIGILDQLLGAHGCAQTAVVTLGVVDDSQVVGNGDGTIGADLLTQTAADTADGTATGCFPSV